MGRGGTHVDKEVLDWESRLCRHLDLDSVFVFEAVQRLAFSAMVEWKSATAHL